MFVRSYTKGLPILLPDRYSGENQHSRTLHIYKLMPWQMVDNQFLRIVVATEEEQEKHLNNLTSLSPTLIEQKA